MSESPRDRFIKRLSTVGVGLREDIQLSLGGLVADLRDLVVEGHVPEEDVPAIVSLHDDVEALWRATLQSNPPLPPETIVTRLRDLAENCEGPVAGYRIQLERALEKAQALERSKRSR